MKPPRLQFSLRMLLLLMAVVGIGLMIYRWPWVEEKTALRPGLQSGGYSGDVVARNTIVARSTYRRDWRGKPVKHGLAQSFRRQGELWHEANYYEGQLQGVRRVWTMSGELGLEAHYRGGVLHGPYRGLATPKFSGQYNAGKWDGEWRGLISQGEPLVAIQFEAYVLDDGFPNEEAVLLEEPLRRPIEIVTNYRQGKRHGKTTWRLLEGELLHTAEYGDGDLVTWNGQPVVQQFRAWVRTLNDPRLEAQLAEGQDWRLDHRANSLFAFRIKVGPGTDPENDLHIHVELRSDMFLHSEGSLIAALCEQAAEQGVGFDYRYGGLWVVHREGDHSPPFVDPTGVDKIKFAEGSRQQREWDQTIEIDENYSGLLKSQLADLLANTAIALEFAEPVKSSPKLKNPSPFIFTRSRRDAIGYLLYENRCRCELRDNTLVIVPRPGYELPPPEIPEP